MTSDDELDRWAREVMRTAYPEENFPVPPLSVTGEELRQRAEATPVHHMSDLGRYITGMDGEQTYTLCGLLLSEGKSKGGRVLPPEIPDAPPCPVCTAEHARRNPPKPK